jgi:hypothetical protein
MTNYIVETIEEQTRITTLENTDILSGVRGAPLAPYDMSFEVRTLVAYIQSQVTSGTIVSFGSDRTAIASPANGQVFFDTDDGTVYQYATVGGWTAKMDFVSSAELTTAIATLVTQTQLTSAISTHTAVADPHPIYLTQTEATALFSPIGGDAQGGLRYNWSATTTATPAPGTIRFNNATLASVTQLFVHESDRNGAANSEVLDLIATGLRIQVALEDNEEVYAWFKVSGAPVDNGSDRTIPVAFVSSVGTFVDGEVSIALYGATATASSGGATGIKYTLNTAVGTPAAGEIRSTNLAVAGTIAISATDAATPSKSAADILARLKVGAIIEIGESLTKRIRATVTTDYTVGSGSFAIAAPLVDGAIGNGATVYLSIASDAPGTAGPAGPPGSASAAGAIDLTQVSTPAAPATSHTLIYAKSDGKLYRLNAAGGESELGAGGRIVLGVDLTLYVRVDGSDNNNGLSDSATGAFLTIQKAIDIAASLDLSIYSVTVKLGDGAYTVTQTIKLKAVTGVQSNIKIQGNPTTPSNVVINCTGDLFITSPYTDYLLKDFRINATGYGIRVTQARVRISGLVFDALGGSGLLVYSRGTIRSEGNCRIIGSAERFMWLYGNSIAEFDTGFTHSVENNPTFSVAFAQIAELSVFLGYGTVFSGLASGKKYILNSNSVTSGLGTENYFPGSTPGTKGTGVIYE